MHYSIPEPEADERRELARVYSEIQRLEPHTSRDEFITEMEEAGLHGQAMFALLGRFIRDLLEDEPYFQDVTPHSSREALYMRWIFLKNREAIQAKLQPLWNILGDAIAPVAKMVGAQSPFSVPLYQTMPEVEKFVSDVFYYFWGRDPFPPYFGLFQQLTDQLHQNRMRMRSGKNMMFTNPEDSDLEGKELIDAYLKGTPFHSFLDTPIPLAFSREQRFSHTHILGGSGSGKTSLIETIIAHDLRSDNPPAMVVIEPHSNLVKKLSRLDLRKDPIILNQRDLDNPPALNVFAMNRKRLKSYDAATREQVTGGVIQTFEFLFRSLGVELTGKQGTLFRYCVRLLVSLPDTMGRNATIMDMMRLLSDPKPYQAAIDALPETHREFFERDFNKNYTGTREEIRTRLSAIVENPIIASFFSGEENRVDFFEELNQGSLILVDTAEGFLHGTHRIFGQIIITQLLQATLERSVLDKPKDAFVYIDEANEYLSGGGESIDRFLTAARKFKVGLTLAHHDLAKCSPELRSSLSGSTAIKFCSRPPNQDLAVMARDMRTTAAFIQAQPALSFATYIQDVTPQAVSVPIRHSVIDGLPKVSEVGLAARMDRNRARVSLSTAPKPPADPFDVLKRLSPYQDEDISPEW